MSNLSCGTFIVPHRVVQIFESAGEIHPQTHHSKKALGRLFCGAIIVPYSVVIIFESGSNERCWAVLPFGTVYYAVTGSFYLRIC